MNNEEGVIEVGQTIPVGQTQNATASGTTTSVQREKATIKLKITPFISPDTNSVRMKIEQQIKQLTNTTVQAKALADTSVVTNDREIKTMISVESGDTAVLGGLIRDEESEDELKVPVLGDIRARANAALFHTRGGARVLRFAPIIVADRLAPSVFHRRMDWLYGFDPTAN